MTGFRKLLALGFGRDDLESAYWERLEGVSDELLLLQEDDPDVSDALAKADGMLLKLGMGADKAMIDRAPNLRYIGMLGTGYGRIDVEHAAAKGIAVCNVADYSTEGVAEFVFGALLAQSRELPRALAQAEHGDYSESTFTGSEIYGKKFGVVGLGNIGRRVAKIASQGFGADTAFWSRSPKDLDDLPGVTRVDDLSTLLGRSDIVSVHLEHNPQTDGIFDSEAVGAIRRGATLVNTAPMELVELPALESRLVKGDLTFILDHSDELAEADARRLSGIDGCVVYPPIAYTTDEATAAKQDLFVRSVEGFLEDAPINRVN